jgi:hypothetical protein
LCSDEGVFCRARERFSAIVTPLLLALSEYTGYKLTLLAGRVVTEPEIDIQVVGYVKYTWITSPKY